jgi:hypothetical protein
LTVLVPLTNVLDAEFRSNPAYELIEFQRLSDSEQAALSETLSVDECFALLRPRVDCGLPTKAVCKDTALLFYTLASPGRLPAFAIRRADATLNEQIAGLVLDGVLQIAHDNGFVSGAESHHLIYEREDTVENLSRIARISLEALRFGQVLPINDPLLLSAQLYFYNRVPVTPRWHRRIGDEAALSRFLGIDAGPLAQRLRSEWKESAPSPEMPSWRKWSLRNATHRGCSETYCYKIYLSPAFEAIPDVLPTTVDVLTENGVPHFKVGADLAGICRADKIVAYLDSFEQVDEVSRMLDTRLADVPVQGVPFTADLRRDGLISWGMDPRQSPVVKRQERRSWRSWITDRLASALIHARDAARPQVQPWRFAMERLRLEGIDTDTWTPLMSDWQRFRPN